MCRGRMECPWRRPRIPLGVVERRAAHGQPRYCLRYNKSFNRIGGQMRYVQSDNRNFLLALVRGLEK